MIALYKDEHKIEEYNFSKFPFPMASLGAGVYIEHHRFSLIIQYDGQKTIKKEILCQKI